MQLPSAAALSALLLLSPSLLLADPNPNGGDGAPPHAEQPPNKVGDQRRHQERIEEERRGGGKGGGHVVPLPAGVSSECSAAAANMGVTPNADMCREFGFPPPAVASDDSTSKTGDPVVENPPPRIGPSIPQATRRTAGSCATATAARA